MLGLCWQAGSGRQAGILPWSMCAMMEKLRMRSGGTCRMSAAQPWIGLGAALTPKCLPGRHMLRNF